MSTDSGAVGGERSGSASMGVARIGHDAMPTPISLMPTTNTLHVMLDGIDAMVLAHDGQEHRYDPDELVAALDRTLPPTATRVIRTHGAIGRCNCAACNWLIDPWDRFCRRCGAKLTGTKYEEASR